jgi:hypothetical protein
MKKQEPIIYLRKEEFEIYIRFKLKDSGLTEDEIDYIISKIEYKSYEAGQVVFVLDDVCRIIGVLLTGSMITTLPNIKAKLNNTSLIHGYGFPLVCHPISFNSQQKSAYYTIAHEDSTIAYITFMITEELYLKSPLLNKFIRLLQNLESAKQTKLHHDQKRMDLTEIYSETMKNNPDMYPLFGSDQVDGHVCCNKNTRSRSIKADKKRKNIKTNPSPPNIQIKLEF